jgi:transposase
MRRHLPPELKGGVVAVAHSAGLTQAQVGRDLRVSENSVARWVKKANIDDGLTEGVTSGEQAEPVALRRRERVPEHEVGILRRATAELAKDADPK